MGKTYDGIDARLATFIESQPVFFVSTAPLAADGLVNCSPKGNRGDLRVVDPRLVRYRDLTGSGAETIAHLRENGRITLMICAFGGAPRIVRLHGRGRAILPADDDYTAAMEGFEAQPGDRAVIEVDVDRVADSCGYGVPVLSFSHHRLNLDHWTAQKTPDELADYRRAKNRMSIDGLPAIDA